MSRRWKVVLPVLLALWPAALHAQACTIIPPTCEPPPDPGATHAAAQVSPADHHPGYFDATRGTVTARVSTPAYISVGEQRGITLFYSSGLAAPRLLVQVDAQDGGSSEAPVMFSLGLRNTATGAWQTLAENVQEVFYEAGAGATRLAAQFDASGLASGRYEFDAVVTSWWADGTSVTSAPQRVAVLVVNERASSLGAGWIVEGMQRLIPYPDGVVVLEGDGTARWYSRPPSCVAGWDTQWCSFTAPEGEFSRLAVHSGTGEYQRHYPDGRVVEFGASGRMARVHDAGTTTFGYDPAGRLTSVTDPAGKVIALGYDGAGALAWIDDPAGRRSLAQVSGGALVSFCDPAGCPLQAAGYDSAYRLRHHSDRAASRWDYGYDAFGMLAEVQMPTVAVDGQGSVRPTKRFGSLEAALLPAQGTGTAGWPAAARSGASLRVTVTDATSYTTAFQLDRYGLPIRVEEPLGRTTEIQRDAHGRPTRITAVNGDVKEFTYLGALPLTVRDATTGRTVTYTWTSQYGSPHPIYPVGSYHDYPLTVSSPGQAPAKYRRFGTRVFPIEEGAAKWWYDDVDVFGRPRVVYGPGGHTIHHYAPSGARNLDSVAVVLGTDTLKTAYAYDAAGRAYWSSGPDGVERTWFDALNRADSASGPRGTTRYGYSPAGWLQTVTDPKGQSFSVGRNALGWPVWEEDPRGSAIALTYDAAGRVASTRNRRWQTVRYQYDALGRPRQRTSHEGETTSFSYDPLGRWYAVQNPESTDTIRAVAAGSVDQVARRGGVRYVVNTSLDTLAHTARLSTSWGYRLAHQFEPDRSGRLREVRDERGGTSTRFTRDVVANVTSIVLPSGDSVHVSAGVTRFSDPGLDAALHRHYHYDDRRRLQQRGKSTLDTDVFEYDASGALRYERAWSSQAGGFTSVREYTYDPAGNPTHAGAAVSAGNRLDAFDGYSLQYDADGNLIRKYRQYVADQTLTWNSLGQLVRVQSPGMDVGFGYDGIGRRVRKTVNGVTTRFVYDGEHVIAETDAGGAVFREYTYYPGVDRPHSLRVAGRTYYYVPDHQGNVIGLVDEAGNVVNRYVYSPFGGAVEAYEVVPNPLRFASRPLDAETGLYHNRMRYYDPALQRFASEDPLGLLAGSNVYAYGGNSPLNGSDPTGLRWDCTTIKGGAPNHTFTVSNGRYKERVTTDAQGVATACFYTPDAATLYWSHWFYEGSTNWHDPGTEAAYMAALDAEAQQRQYEDERREGIEAAVGSVRTGADLGVGFVPGAATLHDVSVLLSGYNVITGEEVGWGGRGFAVIGIVTPFSGGQIRGSIKILSKVDDLIAEAGKLFPKLAGKLHRHHIHPKYLRGDPRGPLADIDAAYHQQITNEFRRLAPYGKSRRLNDEEIRNIMDDVYEKYPLP